MNFLQTGTRRAALLALSASFLLTGCSGRYVITTTNGSKIVTPSKPKRIESKYVYKDGNGQIVEIPAMRVRVIEPYSKEAAGVQTLTPELK